MAAPSPVRNSHLQTRGHRLFRVAIVLSFAVNLAGLVAVAMVIHGRGGIAYLKAITRHDPSYNPDEGYALRVGLFDLSRHKTTARPIVFLGDSMTYLGGDWHELFGGDVPILNRGIGGDTSVGVLRRLGQITALRPVAVFLMIGTNDHQLIGNSPADTAQVVHEIVSDIRRESPETLIYIQALLPTVSPGFVQWSERTNSLMAQLADNHSVFYIDFRNAFFENGVLARRLTVDGVHLSAAGYRLWRDSIEPIVNELSQKKASQRISGK